MRNHLTGARGRSWLLTWCALLLLALLGAMTAFVAPTAFQVAPASQAPVASQPGFQRNWKAELRTLTAAAQWVFAPDIPLQPTLTNEFSTNPEPTTVSGTNSQPFNPTA